MRNTITARYFKETTQSFLVPEAYKFDQTKKYPWLQKLCLRILQKLGCQHYESRIVVEEVSINTRDFLDAFFEQHKCLDFCYRYQPKHLLIGVRDFQNLQAIPGINRLLTFDASTKLYSSDEGYFFYDLKVTIVPWMDGWVLLPKEAF
jgi:hypothetical protein